MEVAFLTEDSIIEHTDTSKFDALIWYKRFYGWLNRRYKNKYIIIRPFKCIKHEI